jgi:hypothetical protein
MEMLSTKIVTLIANPIDCVAGRIGLDSNFHIFMQMLNYRNVIHTFEYSMNKNNPLHFEKQSISYLLLNNILYSCRYKINTIYK